MDSKEFKRRLEEPRQGEPQLTPDEVREKLKEAGIPIGGWNSHEQKAFKIPMVERQREAMGKLEKNLEKQIEKDQETVANLHIQLQKLKHGGGG